jgi:hypothetical protein
LALLSQNSEHWARDGSLIKPSSDSSEVSVTEVGLQFKTFERKHGTTQWDEVTAGEFQAFIP